MSKDIEQMNHEETAMPTEFHPDVSVPETQRLQRRTSTELQGNFETPLPLPQSAAVQKEVPADETQQLQRHPSIEMQSTIKTPLTVPESLAVPKKAPRYKALITKKTKRDTAAIQMIQERCRQL